jgi:ABC-type glycerol-3-phosphate transport system substrate-binding protein
VAEDNDHLEESWALANFLTGQEGQMMVAEAGFGVMPARASAIDTWLETRGEEFEAFATSVEFAHKWQFPVGFGDFVDSFNDGLQQAVAGDLLPEDVVTDAAEVADEVLSR